MKIRNGFVSNSSSSSFIIYGVEVSEEDITLLENKFNPDDDDEFLCDVLYTKFDKYDIDIHRDKNEEIDLIGVGIAGTYNIQYVEIPEVSKEDKIKAEELKSQLGIDKELKLYLCAGE